jgi:hypothetical protein
MRAETRRLLASVRVVAAVAMTVLGANGCRSSAEGPPVCSADGKARIRAAGADDSMIAKLCDARSTPPEEPVSERGTWKVEPVPLTRIKNDPPTFMERPTLVYVALKPTDYFNWGYRNARETHFGFELAQMDQDENPTSVRMYGYADRKWARPFFEFVSKHLEEAAGAYDSVPATLVVTYKKARYESRPEHIEILAAAPGAEYSADPTEFESNTEVGPSRDGGRATPDGTQAASQDCPPDEQILRDARPHLSKWRALQMRVGDPKIAKERDKFEKDKCSATVRAGVAGGGAPRTANVKVFLIYEQGDGFWKLAGSSTRLFDE